MFPFKVRSNPAAIVRSASGRRFGQTRSWVGGGEDSDPVFPKAKVPIA